MLKAMQTYIGLCGQLDMQEPRDAFITAVCRACLPPNYNLTIFSGASNTFFSAQKSASSIPYNSSVTMYEDQGFHHQYNTSGDAYGSETADYKQVVAVGTLLATPSLVMQQTLSGKTSPVIFNLNASSEYQKYSKNQNIL